MNIWHKLTRAWTQFYSLQCLEKTGTRRRKFNLWKWTTIWKKCPTTSETICQSKESKSSKWRSICFLKLQIASMQDPPKNKENMTPVKSKEKFLPKDKKNPTILLVPIVTRRYAPEPLSLILPLTCTIIAILYGRLPFPMIIS